MTRTFRKNMKTYIKGSMQTCVKWSISFFMHFTIIIVLCDALTTWKTKKFYNNNNCMWMCVTFFVSTYSSSLGKRGSYNNNAALFYACYFFRIWWHLHRVYASKTIKMDNIKFVCVFVCVQHEKCMFNAFVYFYYNII